MGKKKKYVPIEPDQKLPLIDCHCHIPWEPVPKEMTESYEEQYQNFLQAGGKKIIISSIDWESLQWMLKFLPNHPKCKLTAGFSPQTFVFSTDPELSANFSKWKDFILENPEKYIGIGEIGLDFHYAKTLDQRNKQIDGFREILRSTNHLNKPYILHVRNPGQNDGDPEHPEHKYNQNDSANLVIVKVLKEEGISPNRVMWHCFNGPKEWGIKLSQQGFMLSVITATYRNKKMRSYTKDVPIENLLAETDSYWQHPLKYGEINIPLNVKYSIAAIAYGHNMEQQEVALKILENAKKFFKI
ncbi:MAG: TatD family hydrolase [Promethearchaeota archaeon]